MKSWKKRALALTMATLVVLSGCTFPFGKGNDGDGAPVDNVDVSDAYFGLAWYRSGTTLNPVMDGTEVNSMLREALYEGLFEIKSDFTLGKRAVRGLYERWNHVQLYDKKRHQVLVGCGADGK